MEGIEQRAGSVADAHPLEPGSGRSPYAVILTRQLRSELLNLIRARVEAFVVSHGGRLPAGAEWASVVDINNLMDATSGDLRIVNDLVRNRLLAPSQRAAGQRPAALRSPHRLPARRRMPPITQAPLRI